jgi:hypothetical protein
MNHTLAAAIMLTEFMNLGVTVVTAGNAIISARGLNLFIFLIKENKAWSVPYGNISEKSL